MDGDPEYCYVLYWKDRMIMCNSIDCSDKEIIFQDASIYIRTPDNRKSSKRSHDNYKWQESGESEDLGFPLEKNANKYIQATYLHWHNLFCFDGNELRLKNSATQKSLGFKKYEGIKYVRNWSDRNDGDALSIVSSVWPIVN